MLIELNSGVRVYHSKYGRVCLLFIALLGITQQIVPMKWWNKPVGIFAHGFGANGRQAKYYERWLKTALKTFNFPDAQSGDFNPRETSLGQDNEIEALVAACAKYSNHEKILIGVSRGASTIINSLGLHKIPDVKAAILESPFDHVQSVASNFIPKLFRFLPGIRSIAHWGTFFVCRKYKRNGVQSINVVDDIPKDLPILFICSQTDKLIPCESTKRLYAKLREAGHENVHILVLEQGRHANLLREELYSWVVHAFYKKYDLPHNEQLAHEGSFHFSQCQPVIAYNENTFGKVPYIIAATGLIVAAGLVAFYWYSRKKAKKIQDNLTQAQKTDTQISQPQT